MHKISKKIFSCVLAVAVAFSVVPISEGIGVQYEVEAATDPSAFDDGDVVDTTIIPDVRLLNALKTIIGTNFTFGDLKSFEGAIDLSAYPDIESVNGLGYALKATSIDLSGLGKITSISKSEFQSCAFTSFKLPPNLVEIEDGAFRYCQNLETIDFPSTLIKIHAQAFDGCNKLNNIELPAGLLKLGNNAFSMCLSLESIVIPNGLNATSESSSDEAENGIGTNVFFGCEALKSIVLGEAMTAIPAGFLQGTTSLYSITIPEKIMSIRDNAFTNSGIMSIDLSKNTKINKINKYVFAGCSLLYNVKLPESIETIEGNAFASCVSLEDMTFLEKLVNLTSIGDYAFSLVGASEVVIPGNVISIGKRAFNNCRMTRLELKDYTKTITDNTEKVLGEGAFLNCENLTKVVLPTTYENDIRTGIIIGKNAFEGCKVLKEINFPLNVRSIGDYAFKKCADSYTDWDKYETGIKGKRYYVLPDNIYDSEVAGSKRIYFCTNGISKYYKLSYAYVIESDLRTSMPSQSDPNYNNYVAIVIYDSQVSGTVKIHQQYFTGLENVDLTNNTGVEMGKGVFYGCTNLKTVNLPSDMTVVPEETFYGCATSLISGLGDTYKSIGSRKVDLEWYHGIITVGMSDKVTKIGDKAFRNCYTLEFNDNLPSKLIHIGSNAFEGCESIGDITIPAGVAYIGDSAFMNCSRATDDQLILGIGMNKCDARGASKIKYIGSSAFAGCSFDYFLMNSSAPVTVISSSAFENCQFLKAISFSDSVEYIKSAALKACSLLGTIDITDRCTLSSSVCSGLVGPVEHLYNHDLGCAYYTKNSKIYVGVNHFSVTIRPLEKRLTVRENQDYILPVYTALNYDSNAIEEIKVGDFSYTFDDTGMPESTVSDSPLEPQIVRYTRNIEKTDYTDSATLNVKAGRVHGNMVAQDVAVDVQMLLQLTIDSEVGSFPVTPTVSYIVDVTANPCKEIKTDSEYYVSYSATKGTTIEPEFIAEFSDSEITDNVEWTLKTGSEYVQLTPSTDGKSATVTATKNDYGNAIVSVKAGSVIKEFNVCVVAPAYSIKLDKSSVDLMYKAEASLTATLSYQSQYDDVVAEYPDNVIFTSSNSDVVKVENRAEIDGTTTCKLVAVGMGTATITAKAQASGKTATCVANVSSENLKLDVSDADGNIVSDESTIYLEGKTGKTYTYTLSEDLTINQMAVEIDNENIVKCSVNTSKNTITFTGLKKGETKVSVYPKVGTLENNGVTFNVSVDGNINYISLTKKTIGLNQTDSVFVSMKNVFGQQIKSASQNQYKSITNNEIIFESSDPEYATVDNYGNVTVKKLSESLSPITITCKVLKDGEVIISKSTTVTPSKPVVKDVSYSGSTSLYVGKSTNIKLSIIPENANYTSISVYASSGYRSVLSYEWDKNTKTIKVKGIKAGTVTFTVKVKKSTSTVCTKTIKVTVKNEPIATPSKVKQLKPKAAKKKVTVRWKKVKGAAGYEIQMSTKKKSGYKTIKKLGASKVKFVKKKLKSKKKYYFRVRAYAKNSSGQVKYGKWSKVKKVKVK